MENTTTEIIEAIDYTPILENIESYASLSADASVLIAGLLLFLVVVVILRFVYKFFRIFF